MTPSLSHAGYLQTREKLARLEARLAALQERSDLHPSHREAVERSYLDMIRQYRRETKLYEAKHVTDGHETAGDHSGRSLTDSERQNTGS